jgi:P-type conjugative transfer ATPase TrbB
MDRSHAVATPGPPFSEIMERLLGPEVYALLADPDVTELYVNPDGRVRIDTRSRGRHVTELVLEVNRTRAFLNTAATSLGLTLGDSSPMLEAELPKGAFRGARLQAFVPPCVPEVTFVVRNPPARIYRLDELVETRVLQPTHRLALRRAVFERENILIAGGTRSGKTTFANALLAEIAEICPTDRLVILEDTIELQCAAPDHLALRTCPGVSLADLVRATLRASPTRIIVGEVRDHTALDLVDAWGTGHPGGCATLHATDPQGALFRLDRLAQRNGVPSQLPEIARTIDLVVITAGDNLGRRVTDLVRVRGLSGDQPRLTPL